MWQNFLPLPPQKLFPNNLGNFFKELYFFFWGGKFAKKIPQGNFLNYYIILYYIENNYII
jgi:hypothetical protein